MKCAGCQVDTRSGNAYCKPCDDAMNILKVKPKYKWSVDDLKNPPWKDYYGANQMSVTLTFTSEDMRQEFSYVFYSNSSKLQDDVVNGRKWFGRPDNKTIQYGVDLVVSGFDVQHTDDDRPARIQLSGFVA